MNQRLLHTRQTKSSAPKFTGYGADNSSASRLLDTGKIKSSAPTIPEYEADKSNDTKLTGYVADKK